MDTEPSADALPVWVGLALASVAVLSVAAALPTGAPDATDPARTVDEVASSPYDAAATAAFDERTRLELRPSGLDRCHDDVCSHAPFAFGPVTPVERGTPLAKVLAGAAPEAAFDSPAAFERAATDARNRAPVVVDATGLRVRRVTWGGVDVTLVGA